MEPLSPQSPQQYWDDQTTDVHQPLQLHQHPLKSERLGPSSSASCAGSSGETQVPIPIGPSSGPGSSRLSEDQSIFHYCEGNLNFSTAHSEDDDYFQKKKLSRDPMSHRIIEKRRRDRMNNCLADLSRLIPAEYLKKGRGRVEKTEIIEMAIKHMQFLQSRANLSIDCGNELRVAKCEQSQSPRSERERERDQAMTPAPDQPEQAATPPADPVIRPIVMEHYRLGYQECLSEAMHFLVEVEGFFAGDSLCVQLISHLQKHCDKIVKGDRLNFPRSRQPGETTSSSGSSSSCGPSKTAAPAQSWPNSAGSGDDHPPSQLGDLLCSSPHTHQSQHSLPRDVTHSAPDHLLHPHHRDPLHPDPHHHHSYKFKNTIKQRFSEEHDGQKRRRISRSSSPTPASSHTPATQHSDVPIFVLHSKGAFYIPLTVAYKVLEPYLDVDYLSDISSGPSTSSSSSPPSVVLHPVTISVNFQQCSKPMPTPPSWGRHSSDGPLGEFLPLTSWGLCGADLDRP